MKQRGRGESPGFCIYSPPALPTLHGETSASQRLPVSGYNMPISYTGIKEEQHAVKNNAGIFDVSHMGEFILKGPDALDLIQKVTSMKVSQLM